MHIDRICEGRSFFAKKNQVDDRDSDYDRAYRRLLESFEKLTERIKRRNDSGKVGINGVKEKDINLTITNSVKKILEKENIQVIMTRETDEQLAQSKVEDLKYRVKIMNEVSPVLAVSIHQNSYHEENVFGAQVFYYQTSTEGEKAAGIIQDALQKVNPDNTKKIKANNTYYILKKTEVPTVIVECGFLSNYKEAQKLVTEDYQKSVAEAVAEGILSYIKENE